MSVLPDITQAMQGSPLVALDRLTAHLGLEGRLLAKCDYLLPGFSKKDRAALAVIRAARESGALAEGQTVIELTSGNMGTGLAIVCGIYGHPFVAVMSEGNSPERARQMQALGAEVVLVPQASGSAKGEVSGEDLALVDDAATRLAKERSAFRADQFAHPSNPAAHEATTGPELWQQSGGSITAFCDFVGSGGTLGGVARALAPKGVRCYALAPDSPTHPIQGGGYSMPDLAHLEGAPIAGTLTVTGAEAHRHARLLARHEGIFGGYSAGANLAGAVQLLRGPERGGTVAFLVCDSGLKYLSTDLWEEAS
ncbi:cysteine synthase family protein [Rhodobacteraceae bacterium 63075]|nr:cysteine synthase family protein [Rhodobacteraceae bacterium 63075]